MKKAMKFVWMVLFALPLLAVTSCGDDEPDGGISFNDYSDLIGKTSSDILDKKMKDFTPTDQDLYGVYYAAYDEETGVSNSLGDNIAEVDAYFTFFDEREDNPELYVTYTDCVMVDVELYGFKDWEVINYLTNKYGKSTVTPTGLTQWEKDGKYIRLDVDGGMFVTYVDKKKWDAANTKSGERSLTSALRAARRSR